MPALLFACLMLATPDAQAGSYIGTSTDPITHAVIPFSGGTHYTHNSSGQMADLPDSGNASTYGGASGGGGQGSYASCSGPVTASWKWTPTPPLDMTTDPPPTTVVVAESCTASATIVSPVSTGEYDTGMGKSGSVSWVAGGSHTGSATSVRYSVQPGGPTVTLPSVTPTAYATPDGAGCSVSYTVNIYPVTINLSGTTKNSSSDNILVGQNCTAILISPPSPLYYGTPEWTIPGDVFKRFSIGPNQSTGEGIIYPDPGPSGGPEVQPTFYWRDVANLTGPTALTITATAPLSYMSGGIVHYVGDVEATKSINLWGPDEYDTPHNRGVYPANPALGTVGINTSDNEVVSDDPSGNTVGYSLQVAVVTPDLFTIGGASFGSWAWLQLCQINVTQGGTGTQMASPELDSSFPYNTSGSTGNSVPGTSYPAQLGPNNNPIYVDFVDSPSEQYNNYFLKYDTVLAFNNSFHLYVMYQPPDAGNGVNWIPLDLYQWEFGAYMKRSSFNSPWIPNPPGNVLDMGKSLYPSYPYWTSKFSP